MEMEQRRKEKWIARKESNDRKVGVKGFAVKGERKMVLKMNNTQVD